MPGKQNRSEKRRQQYRELSEGFSAVVEKDTETDKKDRETLKLLDNLIKNVSNFTDPKAPQKATRRDLQSFYVQYSNVLNRFKDMKRYKDLELFKKLRRLMGKDMKMFHDKLRENPSVQEFDVVDIYDTSRSMTVEVDEKTITTEGGNLSKRLHIVTKDENGKKIDGYFTIHDKPFDYISELDTLAASIEADEPVKGFVKYLIADTGRASQNSGLRNYRAKYDNKDSASVIAAKYETLDKYLKDVSENLEKDFGEYAKNKGYAEGSPEYKAISDFVKNTAGSVESTDKLLDTMMSAYKLHVKDSVCKNMGIEKKSRIDMRNSAMSLYAELLGLEDVLAPSKNMRVKIGKETYKGTFMA